MRCQQYSIDNKLFCEFHAFSLPTVPQETDFSVNKSACMPLPSPHLTGIQGRGGDVQLKSASFVKPRENALFFSFSPTKALAVDIDITDASRVSHVHKVLNWNKGRLNTLLTISFLPSSLTPPLSLSLYEAQTESHTKTNCYAGQSFTGTSFLGNCQPSPPLIQNFASSGKQVFKLT